MNHVNLFSAHILTQFTQFFTEKNAPYSLVNVMNFVLIHCSRSNSNFQTDADDSFTKTNRMNVGRKSIKRQKDDTYWIYNKILCFGSYMPYACVGWLLAYERTQLNKQQSLPCIVHRQQMNTEKKYKCKLEFCSQRRPHFTYTSLYVVHFIYLFQLPAPNSQHDFP